jgi:hypothetical protein
MARTNLGEGWSPISAALRDGTPVILWMIEHETSYEVPEPVGYWTLNALTESAIGAFSGILRAFARTGRSATGDRFFASIEPAVS